MKLNSTQRDRAAGVLLGQAIGDALGVPYEFAPRIKAGQARMIGGGLGPYAPGEWSDDTQMALCIAEATAAGADLTTDDGLRRVAERFVEWKNKGASDIGNQTRQVLGRTDPHAPDLLDSLRQRSLAEARRDHAGNGALMRTGVVGLVALDDPVKTADAAGRVAALTHAHELCVESCVLWAEAVRVAVVDGRLDVRAGLPLLATASRTRWASWLDEAEAGEPAALARNGFTVTALQAAWWAIWSSRHIEGPDHVEAALQQAIGLGHDTDTVAAIAGALLGARYGVSGLPSDLARRVHGWPGLRGRDLVRLALLTAKHGLAAGPSRTPHDPAGAADAGPSKPDPWLTGAAMVSGQVRPLGVAHPDDPDVILGTEADLARCADLGVTAVVSLSRLGVPDIKAAGVAPDKHAEVWLIDSDDPADNADLAWTLTDAARTVAAFRDSGDRVLLHCVAAHHRTPSVALVYSRLRGAAPGASERIEAALSSPVSGLLWRTAQKS